jgi:hypothetical protein
VADKKPDCKCPDCGACKTCGAHPPQIVPMPYPVYPQMQPYRPVQPWPNYPRPYWTNTSGNSAQPSVGGTTYNA